MRQPLRSRTHKIPETARPELWHGSGALWQSRKLIQSVLSGGRSEKEDNLLGMILVATTI